MMHSHSACQPTQAHHIFIYNNHWNTLTSLRFSWFQTFAVSWMSYAFFWVIPRRLYFICRRFGTLCLFHLHRQVGPFYTHLPAYEDGTECSETPAYKIQPPGNHPKESIQQYPKVIIPSPTVRTVTGSYGPHHNGDGLPSRRPLDVLSNNTRTSLQILVQRRWF